MAATSKNEEQITLAKSLEHVPWCEEYEKMISGQLYNCLDPTLASARFRARAWSHRYNTYWPNDPDANYDTLASSRLSMLKEILGHVADDNAFIEPPFAIDYGCNIRIGKSFYSNFNLTILDCGLVTIGDRVLFGPNVSIFAATHETEVQSRRDGVEFAKPVTIGDDCWIGGHVVILPGVSIGKGCTVAAGSVVTKDVEDWSVVMGTPARCVKKVKALEDVKDGDGAS